MFCFFCRFWKVARHREVIASTIYSELQKCPLLPTQYYIALYCHQIKKIIIIKFVSAFVSSSVISRTPVSDPKAENTCQAERYLQYRARFPLSNCAILSVHHARTTFRHPVPSFPPHFNPQTGRQLQFHPWGRRGSRSVIVRYFDADIDTHSLTLTTDERRGNCVIQEVQIWTWFMGPLAWGSFGIFSIIFEWTMCDHSYT